MKNKSNFLDTFPEQTIIRQYWQEMQKICDIKENKCFQKYLPIIQEENKCDSPFLTVVLRTQGKREEGLREALLCLSAQTNQDFEIILIGHKMTEDHKKIVENILSEQQDEFLIKIRYFELNEGTRTAPLNFGLAHARGKYAAFYDDDDILFANWVECFWQASKKQDGRILHSYAFAQDWSNTEHLGYRAETAPKDTYCQKFDLISQLTVNKCPLMTIAFPTYLFQKLGIMFDEELNVTEDWEYIMRTSLICGVADECEPTAIYRFWKNIETSSTLHDEASWLDTYKKIQENMNERYTILPPNNLSKIIQLVEKNNSISPLKKNDLSVSTFYYSTGNPFNDQEVIKTSSDKIYPEFDLWFLFTDKRNDLSAMRFDLCEEGFFVLREIKIDVWFTNGEKQEISIQDCIHNGLTLGGNILFLHKDPEIIWEWKDSRLVDVVHISGRISRNLPYFKWLMRMENVFMWRMSSKKKELHEKGLF